MTRFAGRGFRDKGLTLDDFVSGLLVEDMTTFAAQTLFQHNIWSGVIHSLTAFPNVQGFLSLVIISMTRLAIGYGLDILNDLVLDFHVTLVALDFIFGNMFGVHQVCVIEFVQSFPFPMAFVAVFLWNLPISYDSVAVALVTGKTIVKHHGMIVA